MRVEGWINLSLRPKFLLTGPDAERYLNGQSTNDVRRCTENRVMPSLVTNAKGKIEADIFITRRGPEAFIIDAPEELRMDLQFRLDRYLIADQAELNEVTEEFRLIHVLGAAPHRVEGAELRAANRYGMDGWDLLAPSGLDLALPGKALAEDALEVLRIAQMIPKWGTELSTGALPQEAGLEDRCLDFHKGCYVGQEVISRIKSVGRVNRLLRLLIAETAEAVPAVGDGLFLDEQEVGTITSVAKNSELARMTALAYVKRDASAVGTWLRTGTAETSRLEVRESALY
jgi:folate-binding protein YgfZ